MQPGESKNLFYSEEKQKFYLWVDPENFLVHHNIGLMGSIFSGDIPPETDDRNDNLAFIPNPKYKTTITPYHNNIIRKMRAEWALEYNRPRGYPHRMHAVYLFSTIEDAQQYRHVHMKHIEGRILIEGHASGKSLYSVHDSGWFDFLCQQASIDENTFNQCAISYWHGDMVSQHSLLLYGNGWSQIPTKEVLFYGALKISEESKQQIKDEFKEAYKKAPWNYPRMNL